MAKADIRDRASLQRVYPPDAFAADASANDTQGAQYLKGVRIASAPDEGCRTQDPLVNPYQGQRTSGGMDIRIASTLPPVLSPKVVPRS